MSSEDEEYDNEEEEENEEEENEEREEDEEGEEKPVKTKKRKFEERLPPKHTAVTEISLLIPGQGKEKKTVKVKMVPGRKSFERTFRAQMKKLRRENILKQVENDPEGKRLFLEMEMENEEEEEFDDGDDDDDDDDDDDEESGPKLPTAFWLPYLLSNDTFYLDRVLTTMYGLAVAPPVEEIPDDEDDNERDQDDDNDAPAEGTDEDEDDNEDDDDEGSRKRTSKKEKTESPEKLNDSTNADARKDFELEKIPSNFMPELPPLVVPAFNHPNYVFYLAFEKNSEEWHLLDLHPTLWVYRYRLAMMEKKKKAEENRLEREAKAEAKAAEEDGDEEGEEDEEDDADEENEDEEGEGDDEDDDDEEEEEFDYDLTSMIRIDALMLAVLQSPVALRYILMQPKAVSLNLVEEWLKKDTRIGFSYLSSIQSALGTIQRTDAPRMPYRCARLLMDFNFFFQRGYLFSMNPPKFLHSAGERSRVFSYDDRITSFRSADAQHTMETLLSVGIAPSLPIELKHFSTVEGIQLGLWLMLEMPKSILLEWSAAVHAPLPEAEVNDGDEEEEEEEEEDDDEDISVTESLLKRRLLRDEKKKLKENPPAEKRPFLPAPLLSKLILEIRRRYKREKNGKGKSKFPLEMCFERVYKPENLENGKRDGDPLVTSSFTIDSSERRAESDDQLEVDLEEIMTHSVVRHQKLYQSDLVLLLLAMAWPQVVPRARSAQRRSIRPSKPSIAKLSVVRPSMSLQKGSILVRRASQEDAAIEAALNNICFFDTLLKAKMNLMTSPLQKARSGTLRLLFLQMHRFRSVETAQHLVDVSPLYQLFGVNERCPLPELIGSWMLEQRPERLAHFEIFVNMFWHELYYRVQCRLYEPNVVQFFNTYCPQLMSMVNERYTQYTGVIDILGGLLHRHSAMHHTTFRRIRTLANNSMGVEEKYDSDELNENPFREQVLVTLLNPSPYNSEYVREERRVVAAFESLPMPPRTYYTPETLYQLLFVVSQVDLVAIRYMMVVEGITTVRENPFSKKEVDALEYAISTQNHIITNLIVGLGFSIDGTIDEGRMALDFYAENKFDVKDTLHMKETWAANSKTISSDPGRQYGILRGDTSK